MTDRQEWRVVRATGEISIVVVTVHENGSCHAEYGAADVWGIGLHCPLGAVLELANDQNWLFTEVRGPGELTREEALSDLRQQLADAHALNDYPDDF